MTAPVPKISSAFYEISSEMTRVADGAVYGAGDLVANDTVGANVVPFSWKIPGNQMFDPLAIRLRKSDKSVLLAGFRMHLFSAAPVVDAGAGAGDNGPLATNVSMAAKWIAAFTATLVAGFKDGAAGLLLLEGGTGIIAPAFVGPGGTVYGLLEATAAYVPAASEVFTATIISRLK